MVHWGQGLHASSSGLSVPVCTRILSTRPAEASSGAPPRHQASQSLDGHPCVMMEEFCRGDSSAGSGLEV